MADHHATTPADSSSQNATKSGIDGCAQDALRRCSKVVSEALLTRATLHLQNNDQASALKDLSAAVVADPQNDAAECTLTALAGHEEGELETLPKCMVGAPSLDEPCMRRVETGYVVAFHSDYGSDGVLSLRDDSDKGKYQAIREACWAGDCDPTRSEHYSEDRVDPPSYEWKYVSVFKTLAINIEILKIPVNLRSPLICDEPLPATIDIPLLKHRARGIPRGKWHFAYEWMLTKSDRPKPDPLSFICRLEDSIERVVTQGRRRLQAIASASDTSLLDACDRFCLHRTKTSEPPEIRNTWRRRRNDDSDFAQSVECSLHEFLDDVRHMAREFVSTDNIEQQYHEQILNDAERFACEFLREQLIAESVGITAS